MCGRFFRHGVSWQEYRDALSIVEPDDQTKAGLEAPAYNVAPTQTAPIIRLTEDRTGKEAALARWGLVPGWWKKPLSEIKVSAFNARAETVGTSGWFRAAFKDKRCLVPVSGFYEWTGPKGAKQPMAIGLGNRRWFCLAGLWSRAHPDGTPLDSFTILTTTPNEAMAEIHNRMPVVLAPEDYQAWLDGSGDTDALFAPFPADGMQVWPVGKSVGNVRSQGPDLIAPVEI